MEIKSHAPIIICEKSLFVIHRPRIPLLAAPGDAGHALVLFHPVAGDLYGHHLGNRAVLGEVDCHQFGILTL